MSEALYRKYRPQIFEDVVGQEHIERTIKNAIEQDKVSHAYLFCGPRGTGKTTTARLLAKALLCQCGPTAEPDGTCEDCKMIAAGTHPDVYELDAASRTGVDNVREEIIGRVQFAPTRGRYKIYIIDEVHMLSTAAFNALLKTLEEPPSHVVFILATTDPQKVPETIHSRCQRFDFRRISPEAMVARLGAVCVAEGVEFEGEALDLIAHRAEGGLRNALTSLEQMIAFGEGKVTMEVAERMLGSLDSSELAAIVQAVGKRDVAACFRWTAEYVETGADLAQFVRDFAEHMRNMYVLALAGDDVALDVSESVRRELAEELPLFGPDRLARMLCVLGDVAADLKTSTNARLTFEIALTRMCRPDSDLTLESLAERVEALESGHSAVAHVVSVANAGVAGAAAEGAGNVAAGGAVGSAPIATVAGAAGSAGGAGVGAASLKAAEIVSRETIVPLSHDITTSVSRETQSQAVQPSAQATTSAQVTSARAAADQTAAAQEASSARVASAQAASAQAAAQVTDSSAFSSQTFPATGGLAPSPSLLASLQNPAALQRVWQAALTALKKSKAAYGVLFLNTKAVFDAERALLVAEFPAENTFAFRAVQKPEVQDALAVALQQACGEPVAFAYAQAGGAAIAPDAGMQRTFPPQAAQSRGEQSQRQQQRQSVQQQTAQAGVAVQSQRPQAAQPQAMQGQQAQPRQQQPQAQSQRAEQQQQSFRQPQQQPQQARQQQQQPVAQYRSQDHVSVATGTSVVAPEPDLATAPEPDLVPIDLYDDMVPYDGVDVYEGDFPQAAVSQPQSREQPQDGQSQPSFVPRSQQQPQAQQAQVRQLDASQRQFPQPQSREQPQDGQPQQPSSQGGADFGGENLEALLSLSFGEGVVVREVSE